jgi:hypothetical protein
VPAAPARARPEDEERSRQVLERFYHGLHYVAFAGVPVLAVLLKLLFWKARRPFIEHMVFALHANALYFVLQALVLEVNELTAWLAGPWVSGALVSAIGLWMFWAGFRSLRVVYRMPFWPTLWRLLVCLAVYVAFLVVLLVAIISAISAWV